MTSELDRWLKRATRHLSRNSAAQVQAEIQEHFESSLDAAIQGGATASQAELTALAALGDPAVANRQYRMVMLTSGEARLLRQGNREARAICSRGLLKWVFLSVPLAALIAGMFAYRAGDDAIARILLIGGAGMSFLFGVPLLPIYTLSRSRVVRWLKWAVLLGMPLLAFGSDVPKYSWLLFSALWPVAWVEVTRVSIRRKLPVSQWPKQLYL